jgi:hypothetical protein
MIRRGRWLLLGAVLGISGYRRLARAAKALMPQGELASQLSGRAEATGPSRRAASRAGAETIAFVRDVRTGMADYLDRHSQI